MHMPSLITIDGSSGEGGGQMLRTALALSTTLSLPFRMDKIRAGRANPGLRPQHLAAVEACAGLCDAKTEGAKAGSTGLLFIPGKRKSRSISVEVPTAGSLTLITQALFLPLLFGTRRTSVKMKGGTDVPYSMPSSYLSQVVLPNLIPYADARFSVARRGFYPEGGGEATLSVRPGHETFLDLPQADFSTLGEVVRASAEIVTTMSHRDLAERFAEVCRLALQQRFGVPAGVSLQTSDAPGEHFAVTCWLVRQSGERTIRVGADLLATRPDEQSIPDLLGRLPLSTLDEHFADTAIPLLALAGGSLRIPKVTPHLEANIQVSGLFTGTEFRIEQDTLTAITRAQAARSRT